MRVATFSENLVSVTRLKGYHKWYPAKGYVKRKYSDSRLTLHAKACAAGSTRFAIPAAQDGDCGPTGCWLLAAGYWLLVAGYWLLVAGCWLLVAGCWLPWTGGWYKDHWLLVVGCLGPLAVDWWLATVEWTMV